VKHSLPHLENECQRSVNDFWCCIFGNMSGAWSHPSINKDMAAIICRYVQDIPATSSGTVTTYLMYRATTTYSCSFYHTKTVKTMYIDHNGQIAPWLTMMESQQSLTLHWHLFSRWGRERFTSLFSYKCGHYFVNDCLQPVNLRSTQDTRPTIVDPPSTLSSRWGREGIAICYTYKGGK